MLDIVLLLALVTFLTRYIFVTPLLPLRMGANLRDFLSYSGPAVMAALIVPILLIRDGEIVVTFDNHHLLAGLAAIAVARITKSIYWIMGAALSVFVVLRMVSG